MIRDQRAGRSWCPQEQLHRWIGLVLLGGMLLGTVGLLQQAVAQQSVFEDAKQKYQFAEYGEAIDLFQRVADDQSAQVELRQDALRYLARAYIAEGREGKARSAIESLISTEPPAVNMDPDVEPPAVMKLYYEVQKEKRGSHKVRRQDGLQTLAVMDFTNNSIAERERYEGLTNGLPSMMINYLNGGVDLKVIERERIQWILDELELQRQEEVVDQSTAVQTGELLGANAVVFGSYTMTQDELMILARVVDVETGEVMLGDQVRGEPDQFFDLIQELSEKVTQSINVKMEETQLGSEETQSLDAMMAYSEGLSLMEEGEFRKAYEKFMAATDYDENFNRARRKAQSLKPMLASANVEDSVSQDVNRE